MRVEGSGIGGGAIIFENETLLEFSRQTILFTILYKLDKILLTSSNSTVLDPEASNMLILLKERSDCKEIKMKVA